MCAEHLKGVGCRVSRRSRTAAKETVGLRGVERGVSVCDATGDGRIQR